MNDWLISQGISTPQLGLLLGVFIGAVLAVAVAWLLSRKINAARQAAAVLEARMTENDRHHAEQLARLEEAEQRLSAHFEHLAGKIFDERSQKLSDLNTRQIDGLLKPLGEKLTDFRNTVEKAHREETAQHHVMKSKLGELEQLNERLHEDASNLSRALTSNVKAQGNWGEQQLERLLELSGLQRGKEYSTQYSVTTEKGQRIQPDLVLHLPEGKSIILDSKVSLVAWTRLVAEEPGQARDAALKDHLQSMKAHIKNLGEKRYADVPELNSLDFVLMFVPIEAALIEALQADPELPEIALRNKVALLSPTNFLATMRTVASVWSVHRQNRNAQEIAQRAGYLYDKFAGFVDNLQQVGARLDQAKHSYDSAFSQLSTGAGNLLRQTEQLRQLGARSSKHLPAELVEKSNEGAVDLKVISGEESDSHPGKTVED